MPKFQQKLIHKRKVLATFVHDFDTQPEDYVVKPVNVFGDWLFNDLPVGIVVSARNEHEEILVTWTDMSGPIVDLLDEVVNIKKTASVGMSETLVTLPGRLRADAKKSQWNRDKSLLLEAASALDTEARVLKLLNGSKTDADRWTLDANLLSKADAILENNGIKPTTRDVVAELESEKMLYATDANKYRALTKLNLWGRILWALNYGGDKNA